MRLSRTITRFLKQFSILLVLVSGSAPARAQEGRASACIDLNTASAGQLEQIIHIGPARAKQIAAIRDTLPFESVRELVRVTGIAAARVADIETQGLACVRPASLSRAQSLLSGPARNPPPERSNAPPGCVDINTASFEDLQRITQIGPARARDLIRLRPFRSVDGLTRISGIAAKRLDQIKAQGLACVRSWPAPNPDPTGTSA
jgi:DNA uptake protein ComE-like DNA-binding protein